MKTLYFVLIYLISVVNTELMPDCPRRDNMPAKMKNKKQHRSEPTKRDRKKKTKVSMDKTHKDLRSNRPEFEAFLDQMIQWFSDHQQQVDQHFRLKDADRSGSVNLKDFELGLMSLGPPCQQIQLHMLSELLKTNNTISYKDFEKQLQRLSKDVNTVMSEDVSGLNTFDPDQPLNPHKDRFVHLSVRLIPFDFSAEHPANFQVVLSSSCRVLSLIRIIQDRVGIQTSRLDVFLNRAATEEVRLPPESYLEECGFRGRAEERPPEVTVYYDYRLEFTDCPLLNCDHYFRSKPDSVARTTGRCL
ncbi:uncharacterized protein LOC133971230 isoform X2 [Platichthys flesus]|uniref:uncharacterized protein LOC133971230 isoform X2 n=1 Tax=Platichthys flesus TaxID=8260 RepID=UPI002DC05E73|nr:uncharacterized protein LOC133971230 isoform X2 [Platichthys flesus]